VSKIDLPAVITSTSSILEQLTRALAVPREVLASDEEIQHAWSGLPRVLTKIPPEIRSEQLARMCVAVSAGLFDAAVNYAWNFAVVELRRKVRDFGLHVVPQVIGKPFEEKTLVEMKDAELLDLCLSLNLIDEDGSFFLDQCREVRNNFSSAHPPIGSLDDHEFLAFLNRCAKYALSSMINPKGVDTAAFIAAIKGTKFTKEQLEKWIERLVQTHDAQRELLVGTLHGIYCDADSSEEARRNALSVCQHFADKLTAKAQSELINRHNEYVAQGKADRQPASQNFFSKMGLLRLLSYAERHTIISRACHRLLSVHDDFNNFYNEPPFAEQLVEISAQGAIPETAQAEFVNVVVLCATGNQYGISRAANPSYLSLIKNFSPREVALMLDAATKDQRLALRIQHYPKCKKRFQELVQLIDIASVPTSHKAMYKRWVTA
jgi:hypothetical protein